MADRDLSLPAELLLLSIDPGRGGLFPHHRRRFRKALKAAGGTRRGAMRELEDEGLARSTGPLRRPELIDRAAAGERFHRLRRALESDHVPEADRSLLFLLTWTGVLARRLSKDERKLAARKLRNLRAELVEREGGRDWVPAEHGVTQWALLATAIGVTEAHFFDSGGLPDFGGGGDGGGFDAGGGGTDFS